MLTKHEVQTVEFYNTHAQKWASHRKKQDEPSFWQNEYADLKRLVPHGSVLEIGSGSGREAYELIRMGYAYTGIDVSKELLTIARNSVPTGTFIQASVYEMPFQEKSFDVLFSWAYLPHIPKNRIGDALECIKKVLKPSAICFFAMREGEGEKQEPDQGRWFSYYSQDEFEKILKSSGFHIVQSAKKPSRVDLTWLTYFVTLE